MNRDKILFGAAVTLSISVGLLFVPLPAFAQGSWGGRGGGGGSMSAADILTAMLTVDTDDSGLNADTVDGLEGTSLITTSTTANSTALTMNVTGTDITSASGTELRIGASGAGQTTLYSGTSSFGFWNSTVGGDPDFTFAIQDPNVASMQCENAVGRLSWSTNGITAGSALDSTATTAVFRAGDGVQADGTITRPGFAVYGESTGAFIPRDALALTVTTDTASTPLGSSTTGAGTACRMASAGGVTNWTPAETGAVDGMFWCCTNTGSNNITMLDSDTVYEGPGSVVGPWDKVCFEYVTDRFVETSFTNNEP